MTEAAVNPLVATALERGEDATGLCTVREAAGEIHRVGGSMGCMSFTHAGIRYTVSIVIMEALPVQ